MRFVHLEKNDDNEDDEWETIEFMRIDIVAATDDDELRIYVAGCI